jgi:hypothetical protein
VRQRGRIDTLKFRKFLVHKIFCCGIHSDYDYKALVSEFSCQNGFLKKMFKGESTEKVQRQPLKAFRKALSFKSLQKSFKFKKLSEKLQVS